MMINVSNYVCNLRFWTSDSSFNPQHLTRFEHPEMNIGSKGIPYEMT